MKRNILLLGRPVHPDGKETAAEIYAGLRPYFSGEYELDLAYYRDIFFDIAAANISVINLRAHRRLEQYDAVLMTNWFSHASVRKDIAHTVALFLDASGVTCLNSEALHTRSTSKLSQMMRAALAGVEIPRTLFCLSYPSLVNRIRRESVLSLPFVLKDAQASRGRGNYMVRDLAELDGYRQEHSEKHPFMAQTFIASDDADYRFFMTAGKVGAIIRRSGSPASHLFNTSTGASTTVVEPRALPPETLALAERLAGLMRREVTGVDIMFEKGTGRPIFLEANPIPQIATGSNVDIKLASLAAALKRVADGRNHV